MRAAAPADTNPTGEVKAAANNWLTNRDGDDPLPPNTTIRAVTPYHNKRCSSRPTHEKAVIEWAFCLGLDLDEDLAGIDIKSVL